jgi:thiol-disulfide isomerase/thioredoxin
MRTIEFSALRSIIPLLFFGIMATLGMAGAASQIPELTAERWVNSAPLNSEAMRGKVVLVDFWEYTCINWIRTSPYVKAWHREYAQHGLVVIGVHAPEFEFGKKAENIDRGIRDHGLGYPIAIDNKFAVWQAFGNDAWPAKYLFDAQGKLAGRWIGEGSYEQIESEIRRLLKVSKPDAALPAVSPETSALAKIAARSYAGITAETYVGTERAERGTFRLEGNWQSRRQYIELQKGPGKIVLPFSGGEVNLVVEPGKSGAASLAVLLDGQPMSNARGADVGPDGVARFDRSRMIRLVAGAPGGKHVLTLIANDPGVRAYAFTFGP